MIAKIVVLLFVPMCLFSQELSYERAQLFCKELITRGEHLDEFVDPDDLQMSNRLGIEYKDVKYKYLISYNMEQIRSDENFEIEIISLQDNYSKLLLKLPQSKIHKEFYFKGRNLVSPMTYFTQNWEFIESEHFCFIISDTICFNSCCIDVLETFFSKMCKDLGFSPLMVERIRDKKIRYYLCKNENEINNITGFHIRGMYDLAYDYIITTFNAHYHELVHLLVNYKLQTLPLYTHPFFQEGIAVAFGGRGGKEPNVILDLGLFLQKSKMLDYSELLSKTGFYQQDASLSYPLCGLYTAFLIKEVGVEKYLNLYLKYSGTAKEIDNSAISEKDLPPVSAWQEYLAGYEKVRNIDFKFTLKEKQMIYQAPNCKIYNDSLYYEFCVKDTVLLTAKNIPVNYKSKKYDEIFSDENYRGEKYLVMANENEVSIYNLYTNNLIACFSSSFSIPYESVPFFNGLYKFRVLKDVLDGKLTGFPVK